MAIMMRALLLMFLARSQAVTVIETTVSGGGSGEWCTIDGFDTDDGYWDTYHHCITPSEAGSSFDGADDCWNACNEFHHLEVEAADYYEWAAATVLQVSDDEVWGFSGGDATLKYACCCAAKCECTVENFYDAYDADAKTASYSALLLAESISGDVIDDTCVVTTSDSEGRASVHAIAVLVMLVCAWL